MAGYTGAQSLVLLISPWISQPPSNLNITVMHSLAKLMFIDLLTSQ